MLGLQASPQLGVLLFQTPVVGFQRGVLLSDPSHIVTIAISVFLGIGDEFVGPSGGKTAQMGTGVPIGALKAGRGLFIAPHLLGWRRAGGAVAS